MKRYQEELNEKMKNQKYICLICVIIIAIMLISIFKGNIISFDLLKIHSGSFMIIGLLMIFSIILILVTIKDSFTRIEEVSAELVKISIIEEDSKNKLLEGYKFEFVTHDNKKYIWYDSEKNRAEENQEYILIIQGKRLVAVKAIDEDYILFGEELVDVWRELEGKKKKNI